MNLAPVADLLARRIGLDPASLGAAALPAAVAEGMRALGLTDPVAYAGALIDRPEAFDALADRLVVAETWFFRGGELFAELARQTAALPALAGRPFRALSVPCSSGEEPYSLAIALLEAGLPPGRWAVEGIDLSPRLIEVARRGEYREFSFRQTDPALRERYFRPVGDRWELSDRVRGLVRFRVGNLLAPTFAADVPGPYDLVLCRNLLIYLTPAARRQALAALERLLAPGGLLAVGHAEPQVLAGRPFRRTGAESLFLFRHEPAPVDCGLKRGPAADAAGSPRRGAPAASAAGFRSRNPQSAPAPAPLPAEEGGLARARRLADAGRLDEALAECQSHLQRAGASADAYCLLGVIQQARGDTGAAAAAFRRVLYLARDHREALTHAMLLAAQRGDGAQASALRERLQRIDQGGEP
jgi:chemotaxis protein methyltransferase WspC